MSNPIVIDLILAAVLVLFIWLGAKKGFILTLCSLVAVIVALVGANLIADALAPRVAEIIEPHIAQVIQATQDEAFFERDPNDNSLDWLAPIKEKGGLYEKAAQAVEDALEAGQSEVAVQLYASIAATVAGQLARGILFSVAFLLVLVAWFFISHALDLVSKLPVINSLNHTLGGVLGGVKGLVIIYVAAWVLCGLTGTISPETAEGTHLLSFLLSHSPLDLVSGL